MTEEKKPSTGIVIIEPEAYTKALLHVLRFASKAIGQNSWVEVYGWLVGKIDEQNNVHIQEAIPLHHGKDVEVVWDAQVYARAAEFDEKLYEKSLEDPAYNGMFVVGWYHSHPGLDFFLSTVDVQNHLYFQSVNPHAVAIVFDHTKIVPFKHLGFKVYRLDEPDVNSQYHEVKFETKKFTGDMLKVVYMLQETIEKIQKKQLFTAEYGEVPSVFSYLTLPGSVPTIDRAPPIDLNVLFEKMFKGTELLIQKLLGDSIAGRIAGDMAPALDDWFSAFLPYMATQLNKWMLSLAEKIMQAHYLSLGSINTIAASLDHSMKNIGEFIVNQLGDDAARTKATLEKHKEALAALLSKNLTQLEAVIQDNSSKVTSTQQKTAMAIDAALKQNDEALSAATAQQARAIDALQQLIADQATRINELASTTTEVVKRQGVLEGKVQAVMESLDGKVQSLDESLGRMSGVLESTLATKIDGITAAVDQSLQGVDARVNGIVSDAFASVRGEFEAMKSSVQAELASIKGTLQEERAAFDELASSKAVKGIQKELKTISGKLG